MPLVKHSYELNKVSGSNVSSSKTFFSYFELFIYALYTPDDVIVICHLASSHPISQPHSVAPNADADADICPPYI
jgi:hypothetical protein